MNATRLVTVALLAVAAPRAVADVHHRRVWVPGEVPAYALAYLDLDDATGVLSVWADYRWLPGDLTSVRVEGRGGAPVLELSHEGGTDGFAWGVEALSPQQRADLLGGLTGITLHMASQPGGDMSAFVPELPLVSREFPLDPQQVDPDHPSQAAGTGFAVVDTEGVASFFGYFDDPTGALLAVEVRGPAWFGDEGPVLFEITDIGHNGLSNTFSGEWRDATAQQLLDLKDGLVYLLIRSEGHPDGELRGQAVASTLGDVYCKARPNSVQFDGAGLWAEGSVLAADSDVTLQARYLPAGRPVLPIVGFSTGHVFHFPGSSGTLCLAGGPIVRLNDQIGNADPGGLFTATVDLAGFPSGAVQPGDVLNFQLWYRDDDPESGQPTSNFSDAVSIRFR
jgi:hypothetical protein